MEGGEASGGDMSEGEGEGGAAAGIEVAPVPEEVTRNESIVNRSMPSCHCFHSV